MDTASQRRFQFQIKRNIETTYHRIHRNCHRALRHRFKIPHIACMSLVKAQDNAPENWRLSSQSRHKIYDTREKRHVTIKMTTAQDVIGDEHEHGKSQDTLLEHRRRQKHRTKLRNDSESDRVRCWQTDEQHRDTNCPDAEIKYHIFRSLAEGCDSTQHRKTNAERATTQNSKCRQE